MKITRKINTLAVISSFSLLTAAYPAFSQNDSSSQSGSQQGTSLSQPAAPSGARNTPSDSSMSRINPSDNTGVEIKEPSGASNDTGKWSWVGLLGLFGLFGLKRRHNVHDENYRPAQAT